jgi:cysteine desulfurase
MIYLDNHTATAPDEQVLEAMRTVWEECNAPIDATYPWGLHHRFMLDEARLKIEATLNSAKVGRTYFTRGNAHAHALLFRMLRERRIVREGKRRIVISCREDVTIMREALALKREGIEVVRVPLDADGALDAEAFAHAIDGETAWASVISVDPQSGVIMPIDELANVCHMHGVPLHTDATYAIGKLPFDLEAIEADYVTFEGRTLFVPGQAGALFVRKDDALETFVREETSLRDDAIDPASAVGLGKACEVVSDMMDFELAEIKEVAADFAEALEEIEGIVLPGARHLRVPHTFAFCVEGVSAENAVRLMALEGVALLGENDAMKRNPYRTPLVDALGLSAELRHTVLSVTLAHTNTDDDFDAVVEAIENRLLPLRYEPPIKKGEETL